jgi:predicted N-formylglutamate amidohydrolase
MDVIKSPPADENYLFDDEEPGVSVLNPYGDSPFLFTCDHASNRIPRRIGDLGVSPADMMSHIGWDPGAMEVAAELSGIMNATLVYSNYSRLVLDLNRPPSSQGHIPKTSAGVRIPGNSSLSEDERAARFQALFCPYHDAISGIIKSRQAAGVPTLLIALHSFTPEYPGETRPWHLGITYRFDGGLGSEIVRLLREQSDFCIGDNQPYQIDDIDDVTIPFHAERLELPNALIEVRQDILTTRADILRIAELLSRIFGAASASLAK